MTASSFRILNSSVGILSLPLSKTRPGADCGSDHEPLIAKFRLKLKRVGKTTRPFRNDLNKTPYDYSVEVMNRFKGLDLVYRMLKALWMKVHNVIQETVPQTVILKKKCKNANWLFEKALQITEEEREVKNEGKRERYTN